MPGALIEPNFYPAYDYKPSAKAEHEKALQAK